MSNAKNENSNMDIIIATAVLVIILIFWPFWWYVCGVFAVIIFWIMEAVTNGSVTLKKQDFFVGAMLAITGPIGLTVMVVSAVATYFLDSNNPLVVSFVNSMKERFK